MQVFYPNDSRFELALEQLKNGNTFDFGRVNFWLSPENPYSVLEARMRSNWNIQNVTEETAVSDFEQAKEIVSYLKSENSDFAHLLQLHPLRYVLINDYGTGIVEICRLENDNMVWAKGISYRG